MLKELHVDDLAPWKQRFRAPIIRGTQLAKSMPTRGMAVSNKSGVYQLYTWDISTNELTNKKINNNICFFTIHFGINCHIRCEIIETILSVSKEVLGKMLFMLCGMN